MLRQKKIRFVALAGVAVLAIPMTACATDNTPGSPGNPGVTGSGNLAIYTGRDKAEVAEVVAAFEAANPQYKGKVTTVIAGTQDNLDRLRAEKGNPQAGFLWGGTQQQLEQAANEGLLIPYRMKNDPLVKANYKDSRYYWYAEMLLPEVIIYNTKLLDAKAAPKDWADLVKPEWKGKIVIRDVMASGTMRTIYSALIWKNLQPGNDPQPGYDFLKKLDANTVSYAATPEDMYAQLDQGVGSVTLWNLQDALIQPLKNSRPWKYVMPSSGAPVLLDAVGVVNNPDQLQAARDFEDFLMSPAEQAKLAADYYQVPAETLPDSAKPKWLADLTLVEMPVEWTLLATNQDTWMTYWADHIKGKGNG